MGTRDHCYAVTASHVAKTSRVIRANTWSSSQYFETSEADWIHHPDGDDLAIYHLAFGNPLEHRLYALDGRFLLTEGFARELAIGPGDDIYMVGRFVKIEGRERNTPAIRFGHIAMQPTKIPQEQRGIEQLSYLVEMHSLPGYSGSAVFVLIQEGDDYGYLLHPARRHGAGLLLGIDWGHLHDRASVRNAGGKVPEKTYVEVNTGMACVVPAWKLKELLELPEVVEHRTKLDRLAAAEEEENGAGSLD